MPDTLYLGARDLSDWYRGAHAEGPIHLGYSQFAPDSGGEEPGETGPVVMRWNMTDGVGPFPNVGGGPASPLTITGTKSFVDNRLRLPKGSYLLSEPLFFGATPTSSHLTTHAPKYLRYSWKGIPNTDDMLFGEIFAWNNCYWNLRSSWTGYFLRTDLWRAGSPEFWREIKSPENSIRKVGVLQLYEIEWVDDPAGAGGWLTWFIDGTPMGPTMAINGKLKLPDGERLYVNASLGNGSNGGPCDIEYVQLAYEI